MTQGAWGSVRATTRQKGLAGSAVMKFLVGTINITLIILIRILNIKKISN